MKTSRQLSATVSAVCALSIAHPTKGPPEALNIADPVVYDAPATLENPKHAAHPALVP